jgi:hypothetical protein
MYKKAPIEDAHREQGRLLDMTWVDVQKAPDEARSRLVVREIKARKRGDGKLDNAIAFAAMPPVEGSMPSSCT